MEIHWLWDYKLILSLLVVLITVVYSAIRRSLQANRQYQTCNSLKGIEILQLVRKAKLFPLTDRTHWKLHDFNHDLRIWKGQLPCDLPWPITLYGCFSKVKGSSQIVLKTIKDLQKYQEWQPKLTKVTQITRAQEAPPLSKNKASPSVPVQHDYVSLETEQTTSRFLAFINNISLHLRGEPFVRKLINVNRYWHREDNGCCWLLEVPESPSEGWTFHLAQPVEEMDQCLLTVVQAAGSANVLQEAARPAYRLASLENYFLYRKVQCTPLTLVTLPSALREDEVDALEEVVPSPLVSRSITDDPLTNNTAKPEPAFKADNNIIRRFRNLIEEKREWYEERKRNKNQAAFNSSSTPNSPIVPAIPFVPDATEECDDETQEREDLYEEDSGSELSECAQGDNQDNNFQEITSTERHTTTDNSPPQTKGNPPHPLKKLERKSSLLDFLRSSTTSQNDDTKSLGEVSEDGASPKGSASRIGLSLNLLKRRRSSNGSDAYKNNGSPEEYGQPGEETEDQKLKTGFQTMANAVAAELMSEKFKVSNIDIGRSYDEQAQQTGGWIYCGLEKEVVILRKMLDNGAPVQSYLGKGIIAVPPKAVFEALKNPRTRFTYDEMLKKVEVLHDFEGGLKIVYLYHEVSQLFRKEARDFCLLQSERIEGFKYIISLKSVGWPDCPVNDDITRGKFHSSGWIIEPANRDNKLYSMVTYIVQMELGTSKTNTGYLVEELAAKQPLSISHLRAYLAPITASKSTSQINSNTKKASPSTPNMGTLAAAAAFASQSSGKAIKKSSSVG